jgi:hypothetical protein
MYNEQSFSVAWGSPTERATEAHRPYSSNAEAKAARDAAYRALPSYQRKRASRSVLKSQLRPYWGFGLDCGIVCDVYKIHL